jgi:hypothetical protein
MPVVIILHQQRMDVARHLADVANTIFSAQPQVVWWMADMRPRSCWPKSSNMRTCVITRPIKDNDERPIGPSGQEKADRRPGAQS